MKTSKPSVPIGESCEKCSFPMVEHGVSTGKCHSHARIRDDEGKATGALKPCGNYPLDGATVCMTHGVNKRTKAAAKRTVALDKAVRELKLGGRVVIDPAEAMLERVYRSQANVEIYEYLVGLLRTEAADGVGAIEGELENKRGEPPVPSIDDIDRSELGQAIAGRVDPANWKAAPHVLVVMYNDECERLMRFSKMCRDAGVEDHRVQLAERMATQLIDVNAAVIDGFAAWVEQRLGQGGLTSAALLEARQTLVPRLMRQAIESRVLGEGAA